MLGATLGSYSIQRELGRGGMGAVYVGVHALLGRAAAIKVLLPQFSQNQEIVQRFFNEARAATAIRHPGIVEIYDFGFAADGAAFIVMELCDGESLAARLKRHGVLPVAQALATTRQIAGALAAAHKAGIVHRDLKPDNVFLVPDPEVASGERIKLLDFGIAKLAGEQPGMARTQTGALMGTPLYMSPEQCRGAGQVDHRSDLYALGCMLFEMLCGRVPFLGEGAGDIIGAHLLTAPPAPSSLAANIPPEVEALILHLLAKKAVDRPARAEDVVAALARLGAVAGYATDPTVSGSGGGGSGAAVAIAATMAPSQPGVPDTQPEPGSYPGPTPVTPAPVTPAPVTPAPAGVSSPPAPAGVSSPPAPAAAASYPPTPYGQAAPVAARGGHRGLWVASGSIAVAVAVGVTVSIVSQRRDRASAETERMGAELLAARAAI
ncbi:MAG: protein kinase, partial [Deltaproteobacteria bacterium]|nr:protein kinase [Deltaproteobacteria bacterium]